MSNVRRLLVTADGSETIFLLVRFWDGSYKNNLLRSTDKGASFHFSNGRFVEATRAIQPASRFRRHNGVVLPRRGGALRLRFRTDARLRNLRSIQAIKRSIRELGAPDRANGLQVDVQYRSLAAAKSTRERLRIRDFGAGDPGRGRPAPVTLLDALEQHECLAVLSPS